MSETRVAVQDHWIETENGRLFSRVWTPPVRVPSDETILLFHDSLGSVELWRQFPEALASATQRRVVAYDRLGFGKSDENPNLLTPTFVHEEGVTVVPVVLASLRTHFGVGAIIPFGHSVGGGMAVATAANLPYECGALITESAQSFAEDRTLEGIRVARTDFEQPGQVERLARYHGDKARWVLNAWIETWLSDAFADWSLDNDLAKVQCKALIMHGDNDEYGSVAHPARIVRAIAHGAKIVLLEDFGHVPHRENQERVLTEVSQFLAS